MGGRPGGSTLAPGRPRPPRTVERGRGVAVLVPCRDEEATVAAVVRAFSDALPECRVLVCDNGSTDRTAQRAAEAGAVVVSEPRRGKGAALRRLLSVADADVVVLVDGDGTYDAAAAPALVAALREHDLDMVVGARVPAGGAADAHPWGNAAFTSAVRRLYGGGLTDVLSGYRVLSRRFADAGPLTRDGFEVEVELTARALRTGARCRELPTAYVERPPGSASKLRAGRDGLRILWCLLALRCVPPTASRAAAGTRTG